MCRATFLLSLFPLVFLFLPTGAETTIWYVDAGNSSGTEDGTSWATAYTSIQPAIDAAAGAGACRENPAEL